MDKEFLIIYIYSTHSYSEVLVLQSSPIYLGGMSCQNNFNLLHTHKKKEIKRQLKGLMMHGTLKNHNV
jgi:hypothetical protein